MEFDFKSPYAEFEWDLFCNQCDNSNLCDGASNSHPTLHMANVQFVMEVTANC